MHKPDFHAVFCLCCPLDMTEMGLSFRLNVAYLCEVNTLISTAGQDQLTVGLWPKGEKKWLSNSLNCLMLMTLLPQAV